MSAFPEKRILLFGEDTIQNGMLGDYGILLMPNLVLREMPEWAADLVFNSNSFSEM